MKKKTMLSVGAAALLAGAILVGCGEKQYTVTLSGVEGQTEIKLDWGKVPELPTGLTKAGYTFGGWFTDAACTIPYENTGVETDITLYAKWIINSYKISYVSNVQGLTFEDASVAYNSPIVVPQESLLTRPYYSFGGWYKDEALTDKFIAGETMPANDITLYAKWNANTVTFKFNANGGSGAMSDKTITEADENKALPANGFSYVGKTFMGWATSSSGEVEYTNSQVLEHVDLTGEVTLYAVWSTNMVKVQYNALTSSGSIAQFKLGAEQEYGSTVTFISDEPSVPGFNFEGWGNFVPTSDTTLNPAKVYYNQNKTYYSGSTFKTGLYEVVESQPGIATDSSVYYAVFTKKQTKIAFYAVEAGKDPELLGEFDGYYGNNLSTPDFSEKFEVGYDYSSAIYGNSECSGTPVNSFKFGDSNLNYYISKVHHQYNFKFDGVDHPYFYGQEVAAISKVGYTFKGWSIEGADPVLTFIMPNHDVEAVPVFEAKQYSIVFHGAEIEHDPYIYGQDLDLNSIPNPTKNGYQFEGFYYDEAFTNEVGASDKMGDEQDGELDIYIKFEALNYDLKFDMDGGSVIDKKSIAFNAKVADAVKDLTPTKQGYTFKGWEFNGNALSNELTMENSGIEFASISSSGLTIKAKWEAAEVSVKVSYQLENAEDNKFTENSSDSTIKALTGSTYSLLEEDAPAFEHFSFDHSESKEVAADGSTVVNVYYSRDVHEVSVTNNDDISESLSRKYGQKLGALDSKYARNGYEIKLSIDGVEKTESEFTNFVVSEDIEVVVSYEALEQTVSFNADGGMFAGDVSTKNVGFDTGVEVDLTKVEEPVRDGYTFTGWTTENDVEVVDNKFTMPAGNLTFKATWAINSYKVSVSSDKGTPASEATFEYGSEISFADYVMTETGYTLTGFEVDEVTYELDDSINVPSHDIVLEAIWEANKTTITFHGNGGSSTSTVEPQVIAYSDASKALAANKFTRPGYNFIGWSTTEDGEVAYADEADFDQFDGLNETEDLYAVWEEKSITITFDSVDGTAVDPITSDYNSLIDNPNAPQKAGYVFAGWFLNKDNDEGGRQYIGLMSYTENTTLYAHWELANYEVIFNSAGGSSVDSVTVKHTESLEQADVPANPSRTGYTFEGWKFTNADGSLGELAIDKNGVIQSDITINANDLKLTAVWSAIENNVTYYSHGGQISSISYSYGSTIAKPADPTPEAGETFIGWTTDPENKNFFDFATQGIMKDQEINLYACFVTNKYDIVFKNEAGETIFTVSSDALDPTFKAYIQELLDEKEGYQIIFDAIQEAVKAVATGGVVGSADEVTAYITYATIAENPRKEAIINSGGTAQDYSNLSQAFAVYGDAEAKQTILTIAHLAQNDPATLASMIPSLMGNANPLVSGLATEIAGGNYNNITAYALFSMDDATALSTILSGAGVSDENIAKVFELEALLPFAENDEYYKLLATNAAAGIENSAAITGDRLSAVSGLYEQYEANAYNPISSDPNKIFDGWKESVSPDLTLKTMEPTFVEIAKPVSTISVSASTTSSVTFTWESVEGAYGYRVTIKKNGTVVETNDVKDTGSVMSYKVNGLLRGDNVTIEVIALAKDANGDLREMSQEFTAKSLVDGSDLVVEAQSLNSDVTSINYVHTADNEIGQVTKVGDYYYVTEDGTYIFFSNTTYNFAQGTTLVVSKGNEIASINASGSLVVGNATGEIELTVTNSAGTKTVKGIVRAIPQRISSTKAFEKVESATFNENAFAFDKQNDRFLGQRGTYKVGVSTENLVSGSSYNDVEHDRFNGFRFDVENISVSGTKIYVDHDFKFMKKSGETYVDVDPETFKYEFDAASETFYFDKNNALGEYKVIITAKADDVENGYVNSYIPDVMKNKLNLTKEISFELVKGVNVYTAEDLRNAMANPAVSAINIQNDLEPKFKSDSIAYFDHVKTDLALVGYSNEVLIDSGECDIVDGSADMTTSTGYGPKIWKQSDTNVVFHDKDGIGYAYSSSEGTHAIKDAEYVQNFEGGKFKILSEVGTTNYLNAYAAKGYKPASPFSRHGTGNQALVINGNYFTVDGSKLLKIKGTHTNSVGPITAEYKIQNIHVAIFENASDNSMTINGLNIIGNTLNQSSASDTTVDSRDQMMLTSGGVNGIYSTAREGNVTCATQVKTNINQVNIANTLIGAYYDDGGEVINAHISNSWASGFYGWSTYGQPVTVSHSYIENSGGCSVNYDNQHKANKAVPSVHYDLTTTKIDNFVSGDEQWFKAYAMETTAIGLKTMIESQVSGAGYTIIQNKVNEVTKLTSQCMNWVFFEKSDSVSTENEDPLTTGDEMHFGDNLIYSGQQHPETGAYVYVDATMTPKLAILDMGGTNLELTPGVSHPTVKLGEEGENSTIIIDLVNGKQYLLFRQHDASIGFIQGMVELFAK